jgi:DNA-binding MarR family transcriptional regulator
MGKKGKGKGKGREHRDEVRAGPAWADAGETARSGEALEEPRGRDAGPARAPEGEAPRGEAPEGKAAAGEAAARPPGATGGRSPARPEDPRRLADRLTTSAVHLVRRLHREDAALGLSSTRLSALSVLVFGGPRTLGQLAEAEGVTPPSMTRLVTALETEGLAERGRSPEDGRLVIVRATPRAHALLERGREGRTSVLAARIAALPTEERGTLTAAAAILDRILDRTPGA